MDLFFRRILIWLASGLGLILTARGQISFGPGAYFQNFDSLSGTTGGWTNQVTLAGWSATKSGVDAGTLLAGNGSSNTGGLYSFATNGIHPATDRALGSLASGSVSPATYGVCFTNNTARVVTNIFISYTGEQWRNGGNPERHTLEFAFAISNTGITNGAMTSGWTTVPTLNFTSPAAGETASALDGNEATNRIVFAPVELTEVNVQPGQEIFLRWSDKNDTGNDHALAIDDLSVQWSWTDPGPSITNPPVVVSPRSTITLMTYNVKGNGATNWSTNALQVQAIGRQLSYLQPDIITFNEIPYADTGQMTNWVTAFMPGYHLAMNSGTDGSIRSVIATRFSINRAQSWLDGADLNPFGYHNTNSSLADNFTRDLFEAEVEVPGWPQPLHVFTTHLKASSGTNYADNLAKRAAEAAAITNFLATNLLTLHPLHPFTLSGDMNEADTNQLSLQRLLSPATTLHLANPRNPASGSLATYDSASPSERLDYIFPCRLLDACTVTGQVFRTSLLLSLPAELLSHDDRTASDHLPVLMTFANPFEQPFRITGLTRTPQNITVNWMAVPGGQYQLEFSTNLNAWLPLADYLPATNYLESFSTNLAEPSGFFRLRTR